MALDFLDMFTNQDQFKQGQFQDDNLLRKLLHDGNNDFRIVGPGKYFYVHRFDARNGVRVMSICTKDEEGNGECEICEAYKSAWKVVNEHRKAEENGEKSPYDPTVIRQAEIVAGERSNPLIGFKQSWGPKKHIALNVIDRESDVNFKEKHTSILCKSAYDTGISAGRRSIYEEIVKLLNRHRDEIKDWFQKGYDYLPFDIRLIKEGKGIDTSYDKEKLESRELNKEEMDLQRYDFNQIIKPTDAELVKTWLTKGTKKGQQQKQQSKAEEEKPHANPQKTSGQQKSVQQEDKFQKEVETSVFPVENTKPAKAESASSSSKGGFKAKPKEEPKSEPEPKKEDVPLDHCPSCDKLIPITSIKCEYCNTEFEGYDEDSAPAADEPPSPSAQAEASPY